MMAGAQSRLWPSGGVMESGKSRFSRSVLSISWLLTRLWWHLEVTRLAVFRVRPKAAIQQTILNEGGLPRGRWVGQGTQLSFLCMDEVNVRLLVTHTPAMERN